MRAAPPQRLPRHLSENALTVLRQRYLARNTRGTLCESPTQLFQRVAKDIARAEQNYPRASRVPQVARQFFDLMRHLDFLPNSPTLMNAGRPLQQLSACFVLPVDDSLESIFDAVKYQALIHQSGGGTGFSFSRLRPKSDRVATTNGVAASLGVLNGDLLTETSLDGRPLDRATPAASLIEQLRSVSSISLTLERDGQPRRLVIDVE